MERRSRITAVISGPAVYRHPRFYLLTQRGVGEEAACRKPHMYREARPLLFFWGGGARLGGWDVITLILVRGEVIECLCSLHGASAISAVASGYPIL